MKNNVAYVVKRIQEISGQTPVKKTLQKMVYLIEEKGVSLNYRYVLHFYGPYCSELDADTLELSAEGILSFDYTNYGHKITVQSGLNIETSIESEQIGIIDEVIEKYKDLTPSELELLTTAIYAYKHTDSKRKTQIIANVRKIKGQKYCQSEITKALHEFPYFQINLLE